MRNLKKALDAAECRSGEVLQQKAFGTLIGAPKSTAHDWMYTERAEPIKRFLCGLERLNAKDRNALLNQLCRPCPRLEDIASAHDDAALNAIKAILSHRTGVTFIASSSDKIRTYLATAMGNFVAPESHVAGLESHTPNDFIPIPGVHYLFERNMHDRGIGPNRCAALARIQQKIGGISIFQLSVVRFTCAWEAFPSFGKKGTRHSNRRIRADRH